MRQPGPGGRWRQQGVKWIGLYCICKRRNQLRNKTWISKDGFIIKAWAVKEGLLCDETWIYAKRI